MTQPDIDQLKTRIAEMTAANQAGFERLAQQGGAFSGPDTFNLSVRLEALADQLLGDRDQPARLTYEHRVQEMFAEALAAAQSQMNRAKLLAPPTGQAPPSRLLHS